MTTPLAKFLTTAKMGRQNKLKRMFIVLLKSYENMAFADVNKKRRDAFKTTITELNKIAEEK